MNTNFTITINDAETVRKIREQREAEELAAIAQSRLYVESVRAEAAAKAAAEAQTIEEAADAAHRAKIAAQNAAYALEDIRRAGNLEDIARAEQTVKTIDDAATTAAECYTVKAPETVDRRRKMRPSDLSGMGLYAHLVTGYDGPDGIRYSAYHLDKAPTQEQRERIMRWKNTRIISARPRYAKELVCAVVLLAPRCIR